jgi:hypothetical protein
MVLLVAAAIPSLGAANDSCEITTTITPLNATAHHNAASPGNEAQFAASATVKGNCPMIPDVVGKWSTSDPENTMISSPSPANASATCLHQTPQPVTITYSGRIRGRTFPAATLVCK